MVALRSASVMIHRQLSPKTWWEWVFVGTLAVLHVIRPSRGKAVVRFLFGAIQPEVWVSDMLGSQRGHGAEWQVCLAHLLRDARYAVECGDTIFSTAFKRLLLRALAIGRRRETLKDTTLAQYRADLDRRLDRIMALPSLGKPGQRLRKRIGRHRAHLFVFVTRRDVPATNNVSERHLCLVAEHCWDPVRLAILEHAYRFEHLTAAPGQG